jgi:hypothetical protein
MNSQMIIAFLAGTFLWVDFLRSSAKVSILRAVFAGLMFCFLLINLIVPQFYLHHTATAHVVMLFYLVIPSLKLVELFLVKVFKKEIQMSYQAMRNRLGFYAWKFFVGSIALIVLILFIKYVVEVVTFGIKNKGWYFPPFISY